MKSLQTQPNMMPYQFPEATDGLGGNGNLPDLNSHKNPTNGAVDEEGRKNFSTRSQNYASRHVVNMLVAVVVAFFICWAPQHSQRLFSTYAQENNNEQVYITIYQTMTYTSGILYYLSTCINPFLYSIMSYKFREAFKETIAFSLHRRSTRPGRQDFGRLPANAQRPLVVSFRRFARPRPGDHDLSNVPISEKSSDDPTSSTASAEPILKSQCCGIAKMGNSAISIKPIPESFLPRRMDMGHRWSEDESIFPTQPTHLTRSDENLPQFVHEAIRENMYTPGQRHLSQTVGMQQSIFHTVQEKAQQFVSRHVYIDFNGKKSCRSPYDSPEMSNSSKQLEENLQKILEEVVLHPIKHAKPRRRVTDFIRLNGGKSSICCLSSAKEPNSTGSSVNSVFEGEQRRMAKSKSLPTFATLNVATSSESSQRSFYHPPDIFA